jgi:periplasmic protein TonB
MRVFNSTAALFHDDAQQRALLACFGFSIALHALLLFAFPGLRPSSHPDGPQALTASFAPRAEPAEAPSVRAPWVPPERSREARPAMPVTEPASPAVPRVAEPTSAPSPSPPSAAQAPQSEASRVAELAPAEVAARPLIEGFDTGQIDAFRLALIDAAKRYKRYPVQAMERGWQGRVEIRVVIGADGMIRRTLVKTSSNYQILDDQALDIVKRGKPLTQIPPALRGREFTVDVPVIFELRTG